MTLVTIRNNVMKIEKEELESLLSWSTLIDAINQQFVDGCNVPERHHHTMPTNTGNDATMLLMPAFQKGDYIGLKVVNVFPDNGRIGLPAITADYLLYSGETGNMLAMMDGSVLTARRTAATAALGARFLSRKESSKLFVVGAGRVASLVPGAMKAIRSIEEVKVWNRNEESAATLVKQLKEQGFSASIERDLESGTRWADIISCATLATAPLILGNWLQAGQHLDLIGSFTPKMREADDEACRRARVYIDTGTAFSESGDIIDPIKSGAIAKDDVIGNLTDLCRGHKKGREADSEITLFKAVGTAIEDLAAAKLAYQAKLSGSI